MKRNLLLTAAVIIFASTATAQTAVTPENLVAQYQAAGASRIEVKVGPTQTKVEAITGGIKEEVIYDSATGAVLKREIEAVDGNDNNNPGVQIRTVDSDFVRIVGGAGGSGSGSGSSDDDENDADENDDDENDDDENDDEDDDSDEDSDDDEDSDSGSDEDDDDN